MLVPRHGLFFVHERVSSPCHACIKPAAYLYVDYTLGRYCVNSVVRFTDYSLFVESLNQTGRC